MPLDPIAQQMVDDMHASDRPNAHLLPVEVARQNFEEAFASLFKPEVAVVEDLHLTARDGTRLRARLYKPSNADAMPVTIYFHGGGWLLGSVDSHDVTTRRLALASGAAVLSVDYRRGPDARFPTAVNDAIDAVTHVLKHGSSMGLDASRLAIAGDSAGGNLAAAAVNHFTREGETSVRHQLLIYPVSTCDIEKGFDMTYEGIMLYRDEIQWHQDNYLPDPSHSSDPRVSVLCDDLTGAPEATVILAECDPIRPQGVLYAEALRSHGVKVEVHETEGMLHGFFGLDELFPSASAAMEFAGARLAAALKGAD
ncbi:alpha/beta hydrolase [Pseudonocardia hispaniensis]|uniref:Alpha/beta hydrolase n=1 Tax=Pseudonocardia hispaniensis TaxID=904933 RepID=A0ABW1J3P5_9PSEU